MKQAPKVSKLKQVFIVWIAIYPAITVILFFFGPSLSALPLYLRTLILTLILVPAMVYFLIPFWTKIVNRFG